MNEQIGLILLYAMLFIGFSCVFIGFYLKYAPQPKLEWQEQFVLFLNEKGIYWLYRPEANDSLPGMNDCNPNEYVTRMTSYNGRSCYWRKLNSEWLERIEKINTNM